MAELLILEDECGASECGFLRNIQGDDWKRFVGWFSKSSLSVFSGSTYEGSFDRAEEKIKCEISFHCFVEMRLSVMVMIEMLSFGILRVGIHFLSFLKCNSVLVFKYYEFDC